MNHIKKCLAILIFIFGIYLSSINIIPTNRDTSTPSITEETSETDCDIMPLHDDNTSGSNG